MALIAEDRVQETSTTTGTGAFTLAGALTGFRTFASVCSTSDTCYYTIVGVDALGNPTGEWETGLGTYSSVNTLTRTTAQRSSNSDSAVSFSAGTKRVFIDATQGFVALLAKLVSPSFTTPALGTPSSGTLTNCTFPTLNQNTSGTAAGLSAVLSGASGGTGVANTSKTITLGGNITFSGAYAMQFTVPGAYTYTLPGASDTLAALGAVQAYSKAQRGTPTALAVSSNAVAVDLSLGNNFTLTLQATTGQTLSNPTNIVAGQSGQIAITQNGTPSTLAYGGYWIPFDGTTPSVSTTASAINLISYYVFDATHIFFSLSKHGVA